MYAGGKALWDFDTRKKGPRQGEWRMDRVTHTHTGLTHTHTQRAHTEHTIDCFLFVLCRGEKEEGKDHGIHLKLKRNVYLDVGKNVGYTDGR